MIAPPAPPTFTVATANAPAITALAAELAAGFETFTIPLLLSVAARATMSGTGVVDAENKRVLTPVI